MGRVKEEQEKTWSEPTNRTIYQWSETSKTKDGTLTTKQTAWTQAVRNRMQQKAGEIQAYRAYEKGAEKWCNEHIPQKGTSLRKDMSYWKLVHAPPERTNHVNADWFLRIRKITKGNQSDKCDLCKALQLAEIHNGGRSPPDRTSVISSIHVKLSQQPT